MTADITPERIEELRRLAEAATPGPWALIAKGGPQGNYFGIWNPEKGWIILDRVLNLYGEGDRVATYIAAADPATMLALCDALEEARGGEAEWWAKNDFVSGQAFRLTDDLAKQYRNERDQLRAENERLRAALEDWKRSAEDLWCLLDDIDTASDIAKDDLVGYQTLVERQHRRRFDVATTDGYNLTWLRPALAASPEQEANSD